MSIFDNPFCDDVRVPIEELEDGFIPQYQHPGEDAGMDVKACHIDGVKFESYSLEPGKRLLFGCGFKCSPPKGYFFAVCPRSGLAFKKGITVLNAPGICDAGYRGEYGVILVNLGDEPVTINYGDRIAQIVLLKTPTVRWATGALVYSARGAGGFGSTDKPELKEANPLPTKEKVAEHKNDEYYVETDPVTGQMKYHVPVAR